MPEPNAVHTVYASAFDQQLALCSPVSELIPLLVLVLLFFTTT